MPNLSTTSALNQFLFRQLNNWQDQPLNLIAAPAGLNWQQLAVTFATAQQTIQVWTSDWRSFQLAKAAGIQCYFTADQAPTHLPGRNLVFWPKAKEEGYWWLEQLIRLAPEQLLVAGETNSGVKALAKQLQGISVLVDKIDSARRCALYIIDSLIPSKTLIAANTRHQQWVGPDKIKLVSQPGVFSHGRVDEGSALLIETLTKQPPITTGKLLDVGCGCGLLGAWLVKQHPRLQLTACDVSGFALNATQATLQANQLKGELVAADIFTGLDAYCPPKGFDLIISNPPFHTGKATDYELASRLINQAPDYLCKGGELWIVANRFLPYPDLLQEAFNNFIIAAENGKFRVYKAIGGKR